jgi:predicted RNA-binding Zn-ribbon protein involved in translation (DUF1610 family)
MLSCECYTDDSNWWYELGEESPLKTKRARRCCSCRKPIKPGETALKFHRWRVPNSDIEERIHGDEVYMAPWFMCEECGNLFWSLSDLGFCINLGSESMRSLTREYAAMTAERLERLSKQPSNQINDGKDQQIAE